MLARERDTLHRGEVLILEPRFGFEKDIVESDRSISVTADQVAVHCQKDVDRALIDVQLDNLLQLFLPNLADSSLDL